MRQTSYSARLRRRAEKRATAPSSMKRMSGTSAARSGQFGTAILIPVAAGGRAFARCSPFSGRVSSSWSATMMSVHSAPIPKPGRTVGPLLVDIAAADPGAVRQSGDGAAPRRGDRCRSRPPDPRALWSLLGSVQCDRSLPAERPDNERDRDPGDPWRRNAVHNHHRSGTDRHSARGSPGLARQLRADHVADAAARSLAARPDDPLTRIWLAVLRCYLAVAGGLVLWRIVAL